MKEVKRNVKVRYADDKFGNNMSKEREERGYIGYPKIENATSQNDFEWCKIVGTKTVKDEEFLIIEKQNKRAISSIIADTFSSLFFIVGDVVVSFIMVNILEFVIQTNLNIIGEGLLTLIFTLLMLGLIVKYTEE